MTTFQGIAAATQTISYLVGGAVRAAVPEAVVTTDPPEQQPAGAKDAPRVNVYLVQVTPDAIFRTADLPTSLVEGELYSTPQAAVRLLYLLSFFGPSTKAQLMLGAVEVAFRTQPYLEPTTIRQAVADHPDLVGSRLEQQAPPVQVASFPISLEDLSRFWSGFIQAPYTLSVVYEATPLLLDAPLVPEPPPAAKAVGVHGGPRRA